MVRVSALSAVERERDERRLAAQCLAGPPARSAVQVVDRLLATPGPKVATMMRAMTGQERPM